jgi:hypothetical protein
MLIKAGKTGFAAIVAAVIGHYLRNQAMIRFYLLLLSVLGNNSLAQAQTPSHCLSIKYLDFFLPDTAVVPTWSTTELDGLLAMALQETKKTSFLIPFIVAQLRQYHPDCPVRSDTTEYNKLIQLYFKIRQKEVRAISNKPVRHQLAYIRKDFYLQVMNDSLLPYMSYTNDDGPFYGQQPKQFPKYAKGQRHNLAFGSLVINKHDEKVFLTALDKRGKHLWTRIIAGMGGRFLNDLGFDPQIAAQTSLGYTIYMHSESESLRLYLKQNGGFRYYYHAC